MKTVKNWIGVLTLIIISQNIIAQKSFTEGTMVYDIVIQSSSKEPQLADAIDGGTITVKIKGSQTRTDMVNSLGKETNLLDSKTGNGVILKEYSGQKLMITLTKENWEAKNKSSNAISFELTDDTKTIAGYNCKKAIATLANSKTKFVVYYTTDLVMLNNDYNASFKNLHGLALQYEYESPTMKYRYTVSKINFDAVAASTFDIPKSGYHTMTYEENLSLKN